MATGVQDQLAKTRAQHDSAVADATAKGIIPAAPAAPVPAPQPAGPTPPAAATPQPVPAAPGPTRQQPAPAASPAPAPAAPAPAQPVSDPLETLRAESAAKQARSDEAYQKLLRNYNRLVNERQILQATAPAELAPAPARNPLEASPPAVATPRDVVITDEAFTEAIEGLKAEIGIGAAEALSKAVLAGAARAAEQAVGRSQVMLQPLMQTLRDSALLSQQEREDSQAASYDREMRAAHPDYTVVLGSPDFINWLNEQGDWAFTFGQMLFPTTETPPELRGTSTQNADIITRYKQARGITSAVQTPEQQRQAELERTSVGPRIPIGPGGLPAGAPKDVKLLSAELVRVNGLVNRPPEYREAVIGLEKGLRDGSVIRDTQLGFGP